MYIAIIDHGMFFVWLGWTMLIKHWKIFISLTALTRQRSHGLAAWSRMCRACLRHLAEWKMLNETSKLLWFVDFVYLQLTAFVWGTVSYWNLFG